HRKHRLTVVARSAAEAARELRAHRSGALSASVATGTAVELHRRRSAWLFPGQGYQRTGMATPFHGRYEVFRDALAACDAIVTSETGVSLLPTLTTAPGELIDLDDTRFGQPALFMVQYALAELWSACGAEPDYLLGHSLGEYTAACRAGVLSLDDALGLVLERARLMERTAPGAMYSVRTDEVDALLRELADGAGDVVAAALNGPRDVTISGTEDATAAVADRWTRRGAKVTRLGVNRAFHSPSMDAVLDEFARHARQVRHERARVPIVSTVTGTELAPDELTGQHWVRQLREPVLCGAALRYAGEAGVGVFAEMSPEPVLSPLVGRNGVDATWLVSGTREDVDDRHLVRSVSEWYVQGGSPRWEVFDTAGAPCPAPPVPLPGHPLRADRHWYTPGIPRRRPAGEAPAHPLLGSRIEVAADDRVRFGTELTARTPWFLDQHRVGEVAVLPATAMLEWVLAAARETFGDGPGWVLDDVGFTAALPLPESARAWTQAVVDPETATVSGYARHDTDGTWVRRV
ncbi:acyltransferase domain-containing protein, partial [Saccharomonospora saliphila]|uniref:acyltransferase domain-containing protein n=1 Tax=Saccharomonospora saliphila TaxID=369829 RepID=UPI0018DE92FB